MSDLDVDGRGVRARRGAELVFAALTCAIAFALHAWLPTIVIGLYAVSRFRGAAVDLERTFAACLPPALVVSSFAAFMPLGGERHPTRVGSMLVLGVVTPVCLAWARERSVKLHPFGRTARALFAIAAATVAIDALISAVRPDPRAAASTAGIETSTASPGLHGTISVGPPSERASFATPAPASSTKWSACQGGVEHHPRSFVVKRARPGRFIIELVEEGTPGFLGDHAPPSRFLADSVWGELPYAFALVGRSCSSPLVFRVAALAGLGVAALLAARRREETPPRSPYREPPAAEAPRWPWIALVATAPLVAWRLLAMVFS